MALKYMVGSGVVGSWFASIWSTTSGGPANTSNPQSGDTVIIDDNSPDGSGGISSGNYTITNLICTKSTPFTQVLGGNLLIIGTDDVVLTNIIIQSTTDSNHVVIAINPKHIICDNARIDYLSLNNVSMSIEGDLKITGRFSASKILTMDPNFILKVISGSVSSGFGVYINIIGNLPQLNIDWDGGSVDFNQDDTYIDNLIIKSTNVRSTTLQGINIHTSGGVDIDVADQNSNNTINLLLEGNSNQNIKISEPSSNGSLFGSIVDNKTGGEIIQSGHAIMKQADIILNTSTWCTNDFDFHSDTITINPPGKLKDTLGSNTTYNSLTGTINEVYTCSIDAIPSTGDPNIFFGINC